MSTLYLCGNCLTNSELENAVLNNMANKYQEVSSCPDCITNDIGKSYTVISEIEVLTLLDSQDNYSNQVESEGAYAATTLDLIVGILALDSQKDEYNDHELVNMIEQAIKYHRNHKDKN